MSKLRTVLFCAVVGVGMGLFAVPALAQTYTGVQPPTVGAGLANSGQGVATGPAVVLPAQVSSAPAPTGAVQAPVSRLALTGADILRLVLFAIPLILVGAVFTRQARPSRHH